VKEMHPHQVNSGNLGIFVIHTITLLIMKKILFLLVATLYINSSFLLANPGDTIVVQTFTFGSPQDAWFVFPGDTVRFEKILMQYKLKCVTGNNPACGEWDYLTYTYLYDHTGLLDSSIVHQPIYTVNGNTPATYMFMNTPSYTYHPTWQYNLLHTDTTSLNAYTIGSGNINGTAPFGTSSTTSRSQYVWKASEMVTAGIIPGDITGLQFYLQSLGGAMNNMTIRFKQTLLDSLTQNTFNNTGFTEVYHHHTEFTTTGWNSLQLTTPFTWDGTSNMLVEVTFDNSSATVDNVVLSDTTSYSSALVNADDDRVAAFHSYGYTELPLNNTVAGIDSFVTVALWCYGNPALQPMDGTAFEAVDSVGNRLLNSHLPWSDNNVYWDAGYAATSYDRINKLANTAETEGNWNYWVFTKNVATGSMKIYLNGILWHSGTGKIKPMNGIKTFKIGRGNWAGSQTYEGRIDEFAVFNTELDQPTIQAYMNEHINATHPNYTNLALYYHFDDGNYTSFVDNAPGAHAPATLISADNPLKAANEKIINFSNSHIRPNIQFEQGVFTSQLDSTLVIDSVENAPVVIITYLDSLVNPGSPTDTLVVWPTYYNQYVYDAFGNAIDSSLVTPDGSFTESYYDWYTIFPQVIRYELARYITPYGINLSLGTGWTWTFDVSDYRTLLADSVHLNAGNWQELLDIQFLMIEGTPPRDVLGIQNLWNGGFNFGVAGDPIDNHLQPISVTIPANAHNTRWKSRVTGHGMDTPENCAEFCPKTHYYKVNGVQQFSKLVWRDNCDLNPLYPQGGTWVYDRSNWCPGAEVWTYDWETSPMTPAGSTFTLDHDVQAYVNTGGWDYYQIEDQLVTYGAPNFTLDVAIVDIISPSKDQMHLRHNPVCTAPVIVIKNTGSTSLTSVTITYGLNGATPSVYNWTGNLGFMQSETVTLQTFNWAQGASDFTVTLSNPNGGTDQYVHNNTKVSKFTYPLLMPATFVIDFKTNNNPSENQYMLKDDAGTIVASRNGAVLNPNTVYKDTVTLADGCYVFELTDAGEDGLSFWANTSQGSGYIRFKNLTPGSIIKSYNADFGGQVYQQFTVGLTSSVDEYLEANIPTLFVYPNPSDGSFYLDINLNGKKNGKVEIYDMMGKLTYTYPLNDFDNEIIRADLSTFSSGVYFVTLLAGSESISKKIVIQK
jgi:hypothetical protein